MTSWPDSFPWMLGPLRGGRSLWGRSRGTGGRRRPLPGQHERPGWGQEGKATGCAVFGPKAFLSDWTQVTLSYAYTSIFLTIVTILQVNQYHYCDSYNKISFQKILVEQILLCPELVPETLFYHWTLLMPADLRPLAGLSGVCRCQEVTRRDQLSQETFFR